MTLSEKYLPKIVEAFTGGVMPVGVCLNWTEPYGEGSAYQYPNYAQWVAGTRSISLAEPTAASTNVAFATAAVVTSVGATGAATTSAKTATGTATKAAKSAASSAASGAASAASAVATAANKSSGAGSVRAGGFVAALAAVGAAAFAI